MGFQLEVGGHTHELSSFSVQEASSPLSIADSSGQVGTITLNVLMPDPDVPGHNAMLRQFGPQIFINQPVRLVDSRKGFTLGKVVSTSEPSGGVFTLTCTSRMGDLNIYNVQAQPFIGTLSDAFEYYCSLADIHTDVFIDPAIENMPVVFPGWFGELWFNLKQMAAALDVEISLVSGVILLRPIRQREAARGRNSDRSVSVGGQTAQSVEVVQYNNRAITNELVYPPGGWSEEVTVINVNAGEYVEQTLELSASVSAIQQPAMQTFVSRDHNSSSVFTVVGDDGLPIPPAQWTDNGGSLSVSINEDTSSLTVKIQAPTADIANADGVPIGVYSISLSSDSSTGRYSTLRIIGTGVAFKKETIRIPTGLTPQQTGTEVGATLDNPFISSRAQAYGAGARAAKGYTGRSISLTSSVVAVNQLGESGIATYPPYSFVQTEHTSKTYGQVATEYSGDTYRDVKRDLFDMVQNDFENQVFGNVSGVRIFDPESGRWYRTRSATLNPDLISVSQADDDLTYLDMQIHLQDLTYDGVQNRIAPGTYGQATMMGMNI